MNYHFVFTILGVGLALAAVLGSVYIVFFAILGLSGRSAPSQSPQASEPTTRFLVFVPAHNEEAGIGRTLDSIRGQQYPACPMSRRCDC